MASDVKLVVGASTYKASGAAYRSNNADYNALDAMQRISGGVRVSSHVTAVAAKRQDAIAKLGPAVGMVAPVWQGVTIVPDEITKLKSTGEIVLTAVMLYAVKVIRADAYARVRVQVAA